MQPSRRVLWEIRQVAPSASELAGKLGSLNRYKSVL